MDNVDNGHSFVPSNQLPKVGPLPKADPTAAPPPPQLDEGGVPIPSRGNFNPNAKIDTSTTTSSGPPRTRSNADDDDGGDDDHYTAGHHLGMALGQHLNNQMQAHIHNQQAQLLEQLYQHLFG